MKREFRIVTHRNWVAEEFRTQLDGDERVTEVVQDFGFDITLKGATEKIWWAPGAFVYSAYVGGVSLPLTTPSAYWLDDLPMHLKGRFSKTIRLGQLEDYWEDNLRGQRVFAKLPLAKVDSCPAKIYSHDCNLPETFNQYHFNPNTLINLQKELNFVVEGRFFIAYGQAVAWSLYKIQDMVWGSEGFEEKATRCSGILLMMREVAEEAARSFSFNAPHGYVIDVGVCNESSRPYVVEANASWSSSPYSCNKGGVLTSILAAHDFKGTQVDNHWRMRYNPVFLGSRGIKVI